MALLRRLLLILAALPLTYLGAVLLLGLFPVNAGWREAEGGVVVFVNTNGVHTEIGVPVTNEIMDWRPLVPAAHLKDPIATDYIFFGHGHREFYLETPSWADLSLATALDAAYGAGPALLHVDHVQGPLEAPNQRALTLTFDEYARLVAHIRPQLRLDAAGRTVPLLGRGYGEHDMFYESEAGYSFWLTCNEWTGRALRAAGVRMGFWTPAQQGVMWRLP